jgi:hypothetical protein
MGLTIRKIFSFATLTLIVALTLSGIAAWYSVLGLTAIFAAAVIPIIIMGGSLEVAKVVTTIWLHRYWDRCGWQLKLYLVPAVITLAFITSMGIFGFLSKAHSDQSLVSGDVMAQVEIVDEKINTARDNIESNRRALTQLDSQVDQLLSRTDDDRGANRAVQVRRQQATERARLTSEISTYQEEIIRLNEEAAPIRAQIRQVEAEVGPIKYIAAMIYGDNPDSNLLEKAVRWVTILIVLVFDPLALMLVIAAQKSYRWLDQDLRNRKKENEDEFKEVFLNTKLDEDTSNFLDEALSDTLPPEPYDIEENTDDQTIQPTIIEPNELVGNDILETYIPVPNETIPRLDESKENITESSREIETENVTYPETDGGYVQHHGKSMSKNAFLEMHPELMAKPDENNNNNATFGTQFPKFAQKGNVFVRVDMLPNKVYKFDGTKWIEMNKELTDIYLYDEEYIRHLISKIGTGEYDLELLSDKEKEQIEDYLSRTSGS